MEKYNNTVVKVLNYKHGQEVKAAWEKLNVNVDDYNFGCNEVIGSTSIYYGILGDRFSNYSLKIVKEYNCKIVTIDELLSLDDELPLPRKVLVWDYDESNKTTKYLLRINKIGRPTHPYICASIKDIDDNLQYITSVWKNIEEIVEPIIPEYTIEELTKLVGHNFKIVK
jgi:hypothetical protein